MLRLTGEFDRPRREILDRYFQMNFMGQMLTNPPSVEGWHQGVEWIDTGTLIERINFASEQFGDTAKPGVNSIVSDIIERDSDPAPDALVDMCLDHLGAISVSEDTRRILLSAADDDSRPQDKIANMLRLTAATHEFQRA